MLRHPSYDRDEMVSGKGAGKESLESSRGKSKVVFTHTLMPGIGSREFDMAKRGSDAYYLA